MASPMPQLWGIGYRTVEGGAENATVYSSAWCHYIVVGLAMAW